MKSFRTSAARSPISVLCMVLLMIPVLGVALAPMPAVAQVGTLETAVVDFHNSSKMPNGMFATMATDAVVVELLRSGKFSVVTADALQSKMEELGYREKGARTSNIRLSPSMMTRLGQEVGAGAVVSGEITSINVDQAKKRAEVHVIVRLLDVTSGEYINGAAATGVSYPRIGYTPDKDTDWVIEAINNAASKAVGTMVQYIIPEATIIGTYGTDQVLINKGTRDGIVPGMEMIIFRRGEAGADEVVGRVRISSATGTDARANIIKSMRGAQPEDRVRAVYEPPVSGKNSGDEPPRVAMEKRAANGSKLFTTLLLAVGLAVLLKPGSGGASAAVPGAAVVSTNDGIVVKFRIPNQVGDNDAQEFHIYRDGVGSTNAPVMVLSKGDIQTSGNQVTIDPNGGEVTYNSPGADNSSLEGKTGTDPGMISGTTYKFSVTCVYLRHATTAEQTPTYWETNKTVCGTATYFATPPAPIAPGVETPGEFQNLSDIEFQWGGSAAKSSTAYVIEVSPDLNFGKASTWVSPEIIQITSTDGQLFTKRFTNVLNNSTQLKAFAQSTDEKTLYWRVGVRTNRADTPTYIYTEGNGYGQITVSGGAPPPPGDTGGSGGTDDGGGPPPPPGL